MSRADERPRSVLTYVASDGLGDGLVKLPFVRALRNAFPRAEIVWLAGKGTSAYAHRLAPLVEGLLDRVVEQAPVGRHWSELTRPPLAGTSLAGRRFDMVIDTQRRLGTSLLLKRIPHGCFISGAGGYLLSDRRPARPRHKAPALVQRMLDLVALASGRPADITGVPPANPQADALAERLLPDGACYVGLAPGAAAAERCWPLERYLELGSALTAAGRVPVFFLGPQDGRWTLPVREALPEAILPLQADAVARLGPSPLITVALARRLSAAVANHAGVGHMMAAAGCPLVSLFGPTAPEKFAPLAPLARVLSTREHGGGGMECIPLAAVQGALEDLLAETASEQAARARPEDADRVIGGERR